MVDDKSPGMCHSKGVMGDGECLSRQAGNSFGESENGEEQWMSHRVLQCAKAIGVTMEGSRGG